MSSNVTIAKTQFPIIPGTKPTTRNAQLLISTGIPSLDHFIGGGLPIGSLFLIEEDAYNTYAKVMFKYFIAEGITNTHSLFIASRDAKPTQILSELPALEEDDLPNVDKSGKDDEMKIAWRYQNLKVFDSVPKNASNFGHFYDLTRRMGKETLDNANIKLWDGEEIKTQSSFFENKAYMDLLLSIQETITEGKFSTSQSPEKRNILRIAIGSLGSRSWLCDTEEKTQKDFLKFLYLLRAVLRESYAVAIFTVPILNFDIDSSDIIERIEHLSDIVVGLDSFASSSKETNPVFKDYHGLLHVKKLPAFNTLVNQDSLYSDLAFKLRRKKFLIEVLHLPPELGETTQREQDDSASGCGGGGATKKHKLEF